jgi:hypothetical protein
MHRWARCCQACFHSKYGILAPREPTTLGGILSASLTPYADHLRLGYDALAAVRLYISGAAAVSFVVLLFMRQAPTGVAERNDNALSPSVRGAARTASCASL